MFFFPGEEKIVYFDLRLASTLGTRGFYRELREFSVLAEGWHPTSSAVGFVLLF